MRCTTSCFPYFSYTVTFLDCYFSQTVSNLLPEKLDSSAEDILFQPSYPFVPTEEFLNVELTDC